MSQQTTRTLKIGITGKQNILPEERSIVYNQIKTRIKEILSEHQSKEFVAYSAIAKGADTIFAEVVTREFAQPIQIVLPFHAEEYRKNYSEPGDLEAFDRFIKDHGVYTVINSSQHIREEFKNDAYLDAGKYIAENADEVIVVWDGQKPAVQGSTADILGLLSCKPGKNNISLIMVSPMKPDALQLEIQSKATQADDEARQLKKNYNIVWKSTIVFGLLVAVFFAINASFHAYMNETTSAIFTVLEFLAFVGVVTVITISKKKRSHLRFITQRLKAEKLRLINIYYNANIPIELRELKSHNDEELTDLIDRTGEAIASHGYTSRNFSLYWTKNLIEDQLNYHVSFLFSKVSNRVHNYEHFIRIITLAFVANVILAFASFLIHYFHWRIPFHYPHFLAVFAGIVLPAGFAAIETILYFREWNMLKKNSSHMADFLKERQEQFSEICRKQNPKELLDEISIKMLTDNKNWDYIIRGKPNEVKLF